MKYPIYEYELADFLSAHPNKFYSDEELTEFNLNIDYERYSKVIHKFVFDDNTYLIWSLKSRREISNMMKEYLRNKSISINFGEFISKIKNFNPNTYIDNRNAIHIIIQYDRLDWLKRMCLSYDIDIYKRTKDGESILDLLYKNNNMEMMEYILRYEYERKIKQINANKDRIISIVVLLGFLIHILVIFYLW